MRVIECRVTWSHERAPTAVNRSNESLIFIVLPIDVWSKPPYSKCISPQSIDGDGSRDFSNELSIEAPLAPFRPRRLVQSSDQSPSSVSSVRAASNWPLNEMTVTAVPFLPLFVFLSFFFYLVFDFSRLSYFPYSAVLFFIRPLCATPSAGEWRRRPRRPSDNPIDRIVSSL